MIKDQNAAETNRLSSFALFAGIGGPPLLFGSKDPSTIALWCFVLGAGLIVCSPRNLRAAHLALLGGVAAVIAAGSFVLHEQLSDHPWIASPHPIWAQASEILRQPLPPSVSIVNGEPFYALGASLAALLSLTLGLVVGADRRIARQALFVAAWAGVAYAVYGMFAFALTPNSILWREKTAYLGSLTSTFINRNTAAAYFGCGAAVWLVLLMERVRELLPKGTIVWTKVPSQILAEGRSQRVLVIRFSMLFVCLAAMFMTSSRGGVLCSLLALSVAFMAFFGRDLPHGKSRLIAFVSVAAVAVILLELIGGNIGNRFDFQGLADEGRLNAYRSTLRMIEDHPWFGTGLGTFASGFPAYRSDALSMMWVWDRAHSTPLELAAEVGIPLAACIGFAWIIVFVVLAYGVRSRRDKTFSIVGLAIVVLSILHSSIDFSLQIPGYAIPAFGLIGVALAQSFRTNSSNHQPGRPRVSNRRSSSLVSG